MRLSGHPQILFTSSKAADGNMSFIKGDPQEALENRKRFMKKLGLQLDKSVCMRLTHGTDVILVDKKDKGKGALSVDDSIECDGLITDKPDIILLVLTGDCMPIGIYDPVKKIIALVHASRHNLLKGVINQAISKFREFGSNPTDLVVSIGPSIGPCCYHSSKKKVKRFEEEELQPYIFETETDLGMDLWSYTESLLAKVGILKENIHNPKICTYHTNEYFSHRQFEDQNLQYDYRFATVLGIEK